MLTVSQILLIVLAWGLSALILLSLALARARRLGYRPTPREEAVSTVCRSCRLPFYKASWRCGRCGAFLRSAPVYLIMRGVLSPLLSLIVVPWIIGVGLVLMAGLWLTSNLLPEVRARFERVTNRLGVWVAPLFERWVPERWRLPVTGVSVEPEEVDAPVDVVAASALILAASLLERPDARIEVEVPEPEEETLRLLREAPSGIHEIWGYVSDGHPLAPNFRDRIIAARFGGEDLLSYSEGLAEHLQTPMRQVIIRPALADPESTASAPGDWRFVLRRQPGLAGEYPIRWEIHASTETGSHIDDVVEDLHSWKLLPCELAIE